MKDVSLVEQDNFVILQPEPTIKSLSCLLPSYPALQRSLSV